MLKTSWAKMWDEIELAQDMTRPLLVARSDLNQLLILGKSVMTRLYIGDGSQEHIQH